MTHVLKIFKPVAVVFNDVLTVLFWRYLGWPLYNDQKRHSADVIRYHVCWFALFEPHNTALELRDVHILSVVLGMSAHIDGHKRWVVFLVATYHPGRGSSQLAYLSLFVATSLCNYPSAPS